MMPFSKNYIKNVKFELGGFIKSQLNLVANELLQKAILPSGSVLSIVHCRDVGRKIGAFLLAFLALPLPAAAGKSVKEAGEGERRVEQSREGCNGVG